MKKNTVKFLMGMLMIASFIGMSVSCQDKPEPEPEQPDVPYWDMVADADTIQIEGEYPVPHPEIPMLIYQNEVKASPDGVSVEVTDITETNFVFTCRPGANVASYRLDVYPLAILYNYMLEEGGMGVSRVDVERIIISHLFNTSGSGGFAFDQGTLGDDYFELEFDWANTAYAQQKIVPGCQYIIAVGACYDDSASEASLTDLKLIYVETPKKELVGNPFVQIDVHTTYVGAQIRNVPNEDAAGVYFYCTDASAIDAYEEAFGGRLLRDFIRNGYIPNDPVPANDPDKLVYQIGPWSQVDPTHVFTSIAFACDANLTPAASYARQDFTLKEKPAGREDAVLFYEVGDIVGASYLEIDVNLGKECVSGYHLLLPMDYSSYDGYYRPAREYIEGSDELKTELRDMIAAYGYGISNKNFSFDQNTQQPSGSEFKTSWAEYARVIPDAEYVIAYCGKNAFNEYTEIFFSEPFRTKPRVTDRPQDCKANTLLTFTDITPSGARFVVTYDPEHTANVWFINTGMNDQLPPYDVPSATDSREVWMDYFFEGGDHSMYMNQWWRNPSGEESFAFTGFDPRSTFTYAYVAEDLDGVVSEVKFAQYTTGGMAPGSDPTMELVPTYDAATGTWSVMFNSVKDVATFRYLVQCDDENPLFLSALPTEPGGSSDMRAFEFYNHWFTKVGDPNYGGLIASTGYLGSPVKSDPMNAGKDHLAGCVAFGEDEDGNPVTSKLFYWILPGDGSEPRKLNWYFPNYQEK